MADTSNPEVLVTPMLSTSISNESQPHPLLRPGSSGLSDRRPSSRGSASSAGERPLTSHSQGSATLGGGSSRGTSPDRNRELPPTPGQEGQSTPRPTASPPSFPGYQAQQAAPAPTSQQRVGPAGPVPGVPLRSFWACMTLNMTDRIRLINFTEQDFHNVCQIVQRWYPKGEGVRTRKYGAADEIVCSGSPWARNVDGNDRARLLLLEIIRGLFHKGWIMQSSVDISKKERDKDSLVFRLQQPAPPRCDWMAVSFDGFGKLKAVGVVPEDFVRQLVGAYSNLVASFEYKEISLGHRLKVHFRGSCWYPEGEETVLTRQMLLTLYDALEHSGFSVLGSVNMSSGPDYRGCDVLICNRVLGWAPGAPVHHR